MFRSLIRPLIALAILAILAILVSAWAWVRRGPARDALQFPNASLLLVSIDTLRADPLGCYGSDLGLTPNLDRLAKEGVIFLNAAAAANHTAPSHATMLTGTSPDVHGVVNTIFSSPHVIPHSIRTLAERLLTAGWRTSGDTDGGYVHRAFGFNRGFEEFQDNATGIAPKVDRCLAFFDGLAPGKRGFFFLHTYETHGPYRVSPAQADEIFKRFPNSIIPGRYRALANVSRDHLAAEVSGLLVKFEKFNRVDSMCLRELYHATIRNVDRELGRLVEGLRGRGLLDQMVVVVTSDHGEEFGEHGGYQHEGLFDEVMRVPLVMRFPGGRLAGAALATSFGSVHLTPTLLDVLGIAPDRMEGRSQRFGIAAGETDEHARVAFASHMKGEAIVGHAVRTPLAKVLTVDGDPAQRIRAYDLEKDPIEQRPGTVDTVRGSSYLADRLKTQLSVWRAFARSYFEGTTQQSELSEEHRRYLESLGYTR